MDTGALATFPFRKDRFVLAVARGHPLAKRGEIAFADVLDQNFVGLDRASAIQRFLADKAARAGKPLRLRIQLRSFDAVCRMVESNVGVGIVPETTARRAARTMAIASVALKDAWALRELTICVRDLRICRTTPGSWWIIYEPEKRGNRLSGARDQLGISTQ